MNSKPEPSGELLHRIMTEAPITHPKTAIAGETQEPLPKSDKLEPGNFSITPLELEAYLNQFVIGQPEAVSVLATKIATHYNRMRLETTRPDLPPIIGNVKPNVILIGPTGVGKTYILRLIAEFISVPFAKGDATKFSETGYVGGDVEDLVRELVRNAGGDIQAAERGIIYIDEIDKIASPANVSGIDVSRTGVQRNLLKIMEDTDVDMKVPHDIASQMEAVMQMQRTGKAESRKVNTRNILFVVSGAFANLEDIVKKRIRGSSMGFGSNSKQREELEWSKHITSRDLVSFGFETEFVGRLPVTVTLNPLGVNELFTIMSSPNGAVMQGKKRDFLAYNIDLDFTPGALKILAQRAADEQTGARGILAVLEKLLLPFEKLLPGQATSLLVDEELLKNPEHALELAPLRSSIRDFQKRMLIDHNLTIAVPAAAERWIIAASRAQHIRPDALLSASLKDYPYGLTLLKQNALELHPELLEDPQRYLAETIKTAYTNPSKRDKK